MLRVHEKSILWMFVFTILWSTARSHEEIWIKNTFYAVMTWRHGEIIILISPSVMNFIQNVYSWRTLNGSCDKLLYYFGRFDGPNDIFHERIFFQAFLQQDCPLISPQLDSRQKKHVLNSDAIYYFITGDTVRFVFVHTNATRVK